MISTKKLIKMAKKWQKFAATQKKIIVFPKDKENANADRTASSTPTTSTTQADKWCFTVYSADQQGFRIPLYYLNNEIFKELLQMSEEEFGLPNKRPIILPVDAAIPLSDDHKPDRSDERERIEQAGGFVILAGTWRVSGVLAVSRAFGDKLLKPFVIAEPEIQEEEIDSVEFIIIASDGLWNVISNKDAVAIVQDIEDPEAACRRLTEEAYSKGSSDNITCIVVRFDKQ